MCPFNSRQVHYSTNWPTYMKCRKPLNLLGLRHFFFYVVIAVKMLKMQYFATLCNTKNDDTV